MRVFLVTSFNTKHICKASLHQWKKYTPFDVVFLDVHKTNLENWCKEVEKQLTSKLLPNEGRIIFGLDDYLVIDHFRSDIFAWVNTRDYDRYELGWGALNKKPYKIIETSHGRMLAKYAQDAQYLSSCQISVWNIDVLLFILGKCKSPWDFEIRGTEIMRKIKDFKVFGTKEEYALRWQEESCLSFRRNKNKINILGLPPSDVDELVSLNFLDRSRLNYGINNGGSEIPENKGGRKYARFYA